MTHSRLELPEELEGNIRVLIEETGTSADILGITRASELVQLGRHAVAALLRYWRESWASALAQYGYVPYEAGYERYIYRLACLLPYTEDAPTMPADRGLTYFCEPFYWVFAPDSAKGGRWSWQHATVKGRKLEIVDGKRVETITMVLDDGTEIDLYTTSPRAVSDEDLNKLRQRAPQYARPWLAAASFVSDEIRADIEYALTGVLS